MMIPIILPISSDKPKCSYCGKEEKKIEICNHCGHKYKEEPIGCIGLIIVILMIILFLWIAVTLMDWLFIKNDPLWEILKNQWQWLKDLRLY